MDDITSLVFVPIALDDDFPMSVGPCDVQHDRPIRELHWHDSLEIGICVEGSGIFVVGEKVLSFSAGDVTVIGPSEVHLARSLPGTTSRWYWIYLDPLRILPQQGRDVGMLDQSALAGPGFDNVLHPADDPAIYGLVERMVAEVNGRLPGHRVSLAAMATELMVRVRRARTGDPTSTDRAGLDRIAPAIAMIARDFTGELSVTELARACAISDVTLRREFRRVVGQSPREYWTAMRLRMAASILRATTLSVIATSRQAGFTTLSSFNRLFVRHYGMTPREWRSVREP